MKIIELNKCKDCDHCVESKQGIKCFNPKSDNFNQNIKLDDDCCEHIETNYYSAPKEIGESLFNE